MNLPKLTEDQRQELDSPITMNEIVEEIGSLPFSKSLGPDGFAADCLSVILLR